MTDRTERTEPTRPSGPSGPAPRVRVTGPPRRHRSPLPRGADIDADTALGDVYLGSLLRAQLGLAARVLLLLVVGVGSLPLVFHLFPSLARVDVAGLPLSWLLLGVAVYPYLLMLGLHYVRRAEHNEASFAELLSHRDPEDRR
ncbi:MAG TPA: hypothetical protein VGE38_04315 [Nocardioides sp.]|uniref:hypothetical protein n=1 Tax=Nocardioides sp. TaxID=35761 RepID=UPI002EDB100B